MIYFVFVNAVEIIREIELLPPEQKAKVLEFVRASEKKKPLSPKELVELADKLVAAESKEQADALEAEIVKSFYGK